MYELSQINNWEDISKERNMKQKTFLLGKSTRILLFTLFWAQMSPILCKPWELLGLQLLFPYFPSLYSFLCCGTIIIYRQKDRITQSPHWFSFPSNPRPIQLVYNARDWPFHVFCSFLIYSETLHLILVTPCWLIIIHNYIFINLEFIWCKMKMNLQMYFEYWQLPAV